MIDIEQLLRLFMYLPEEPMLFTGMFFWLFFASVLAVYTLIYKQNAARSAFLFAASLFFYYKSSGYYFGLLLFSTVVDYAIGFAIYSSGKRWKKKIWLSLSLLVNLGLLGYFKYTYFIADCVHSLSGAEFSATNVLAYFANATFGTAFAVDNIILPVGISFYTFQTISYSMDIYRGRIAPVKNIIDFGFYVSFFPQLVAGPIVRAAEFIPQIYKNYSLSKQQFGHALFLILNGLLKKMIISDYISINFVDRIFESPASFTGIENLFAVYGYAIQIYCDFSGYTDIAIGVALLLGYQLPLNFNSPYKAESITDFWRRWHISLSSWLKDYLYISLGGNRKGKIRTYINLLMTMLLGGLWHGAHLRFIIWGGLHGIALAFHKMWIAFTPFNDWENKVYRFFAIFITFHFVCFAWIFFRATDLSSVSDMLYRIVFHFNGQLFPDFLHSHVHVVGILLLGFVAHWLPTRWKYNVQSAFIRSPMIVKVLASVAVAIVVYQAKSADIQPFIYFQF